MSLLSSNKKKSGMQCDTVAMLWYALYNNISSQRHIKISTWFVQRIYYINIALIFYSKNVLHDKACVRWINTYICVGVHFIFYLYFTNAFYPRLNVSFLLNILWISFSVYHLIFISSPLFILNLGRWQCADRYVAPLTEFNQKYCSGQFLIDPI